MNWAKLKLPAIAFVVLCLASYVVFLEVQASEDSDAQIDESAVWNPPPGALLQIGQNCGPQSADYSNCFIEQMSTFDAPTDAVAFTQTYADHNRGTIALLKEFRSMDAVDLGYVSFPASTGTGAKGAWLLLNGTPDIINVDNVDLLPQSDMTKDTGYAALRRHHPKVALYSGDHDPVPMPAAATLPDGSQQFTMDYSLKDGCRECAAVGRATFRFDFDPAGKLTEVKFVNVTLAGR
jgi:hypothetical protein